METHERPGRLLELVGIAAFSLAAFSYCAGYIPSEFRSTRGTVINSRVTSLDDAFPANRVRQSTAQTKPTKSFTRVSYRYKVDGRVYENETQSDVMTNSRPDRIAKSLGPGKALTVYYNRLDPYQSHIWNEFPHNECFLLILAVGSYLLAFLCRKFEPVARFLCVSVEGNEPEGSELGLATISPSGEPSFT